MTESPSFENSTMELSTERLLTSSDAAYWPAWLNIGAPIVAIVMFIITIVLSFRHKHKSHGQLRLPVIITKCDTNNSAASLDRKSEGSDRSDSNRKNGEAQDTVSDMLQKAKEQAMKSRTARRLSSIRSRVSSSSQYEYSHLDEDTRVDHQIRQDSSDDDKDDDDVASSVGDGACSVVGHVVTVNIEHHTPPRHALAHMPGQQSEDSGFTSNQSSGQSRTSSSEIGV